MRPDAAERPHRPQQVPRPRRRARQARGGAVRLDELDGDGPLRADQQHDRLRRRADRAALPRLLEGSLPPDTKAAGGDRKAFRHRRCALGHTVEDAHASARREPATSWFSPNTPKLRASLANEKRPPDMEEVAQLIAGAKHAVLFLAFYPGSPSLANWAAAAQKANKDLFVRGCVTHPSAAEAFYYELARRRRPRCEVKTPRKQDPRVIQAEAFDGKSSRRAGRRRSSTPASRSCTTRSWSSIRSRPTASSSPAATTSATRRRSTTTRT